MKMESGLFCKKKGGHNLHSARPGHGWNYPHKHGVSEGVLTRRWCLNLTMQAFERGAAAGKHWKEAKQRRARSEGWHKSAVKVLKWSFQRGGAQLVNGFHFFLFVILLWGSATPSGGNEWVVFGVKTLNFDLVVNFFFFFGATDAWCAHFFPSCAKARSWMRPVFPGFYGAHHGYGVRGLRHAAAGEGALLAGERSEPLSVNFKENFTRSISLNRFDAFAEPPGLSTSLLVSPLLLKMESSSVRTKERIYPCAVIYV